MKMRLCAEVQGVDDHIPIRLGPERDPHRPVNRHGQDKTGVIVGVLTDQVNPPRRPHHPHRRLPEQPLKLGHHTLLHAHVPLGSPTDL